jgi:hypothetical protein
MFIEEREGREPNTIHAASTGLGDNICGGIVEVVAVKDTKTIRCKKCGLVFTTRAAK